MSEQVFSSVQASSPTGFAAALRSPAFVVLWLSEAVSLIGDRLVIVALMMLVYEHTQSAAAVSLLGISKAMPALILGMLAGVFVDRWPRKATMVFSNLLQGMLVLLIPFTDALPVIFGVYFGMSIINQFFVPARSATIPNLVPAAALTAANALFAMAFVAAIAIGPAIGSWIAGQFGLDVAFYVDAATFLIPAFAVSLLAIPKTQPVSKRNSLGTDWQEGLALVRSRREMSNALILIASVALIIASLSVVGVLIADQNLNGDASDFGFLMSAMGVGMLSGAALANRLASHFKRQRLAAVGAILAGLASGALPWCPNFFFGLVCAVLLGFGFIITQINSQTILQSTPDRLRGRMLGLSQAVMGSMTFVIAAVAGLLAERVGAAAVMLGVGTTTVVVACLVLYFSRNS